MDLAVTFILGAKKPREYSTEDGSRWLTFYLELWRFGAYFCGNFDSVDEVSQRLMSSGQELSDNQQIAGDGNDAMHSNRAIRWRPGKHQVAKNRHKLIRPNQSGHTEDEVQLHQGEED